VGVEQDGLAAKEISAPEAVFQMTDKRQSGRAVTGIGSWSIVLFKYASEHIFMDVHSECFVNLLCYTGTAKQWITLLQIDDGFYEFL
jgi:hypothetical protein